MATIYSLDTKTSELYIFNSVKKMVGKNSNTNVAIYTSSPNQDDSKQRLLSIKVIFSTYHLSQPDNNSKNSDIFLSKHHKKVAIEITRALNKPFLEFSDRQVRELKDKYGTFYDNIQDLLEQDFVSDSDLINFWGNNVIYQIIYQTKEKIEKAWNGYYHKYDKNILMVAFDWPEALTKNKKLQTKLFAAMKSFYHNVLLDLINNDMAFFEYFIFAGYNGLQLEQVLIYY